MELWFCLLHRLSTSHGQLCVCHREHNTLAVYIKGMWTGLSDLKRCYNLKASSLVLVSVTKMNANLSPFAFFLGKLT